MSVHVLKVRNVNEALQQLMNMDKSEWLITSPRGMQTMEYPGTFITEYTHPVERVLFDVTRDANPFFHFMESLWILNGQSDVDTLAHYNSQMTQFSDNGVSFHAPYGWRLRNHFGLDQLIAVIKILRSEPNTRRAVLSIWDPSMDLGKPSKDIPCNDLIMFKIRDGELNMTVCCRSNDAILGAYGANAVQFSMIQEFVARSVGVRVGVYRQISDSFHVYSSQPQWLRMCEAEISGDIYEIHGIEAFPIMKAFPPNTDYHLEWLRQLRWFMGRASRVVPYKSQIGADIDAFFTNVAMPIRDAWDIYKEDQEASKNTRIDEAQERLDDCWARDWAVACHEWLERRRTV